jgi:hypothetical protein
MQVRGDTSCIYALGGSFISLRRKEKLGLYFFSVGDVIYWNYREILRLYEIGTYSKVNIKYFNPLTYDSITKIALF